MRLVTFSYTNEYDNRSEVMVNPALVVRIREDGLRDEDKTTITFVDGSITVDGTLDEVAAKLAAEPAMDLTSPGIGASAAAVPPVAEGDEFP